MLRNCWTVSDVKLRHDHLYEDLQSHIITSEEFGELPTRSLQGIKVYMCTLSMLSSRRLSKFTTRVPIRTLVVDEASQIKTGDYVNVFVKFKEVLRKMCFIGDPKQCMCS